MKRIILTLMLFTALLISACGSGSMTTLVLVAHSTSETVIDVDPEGDSVGDQVIFSNDIYDTDMVEKIGTDYGICVSLVTPLIYECIVTMELPDGQITTAGIFSSSRTTNVAAIIGGTEEYSGARGHVTIQVRGGEITDLTFEIIR